MQFSPETIRKAKEELREDEDKKNHSLEHFKTWLKIHPFIKNCCTEDFFLLSFLRVKKFWNDKAFKVIENYLIFRQKYKEWFDLSDKQIEKYRELVKCGYSFFSHERNNDGSAVLIFNVATVDLDKFSIDDLFQCIFTNLTLALLDQKTQVCGISFVGNLSNASVKQVTIYPVSYVVTFAKHLINSGPMRLKAINLIGAPVYANSIINVLKLALSEKLRNRMHILKEMNELVDATNKECLPKELNGEITQNEMIEKHLIMFDEKLPLLIKLGEYELSMNKIDQRLKSETIGSFRKLNID
ncbi:hypothetical protein PVAND_013762 [Polypedilum vanderplanki]|uniref:CRAL-TRIO domain-containing protein n=1 Tax=Polypedilum vanderplanki TaxID=319348 RepID=A0A9J6CSA9_POLVA|nr:hypothetical protein PVAND_013762 [Polypedilum vanderplanki]